MVRETFAPVLKEHGFECEASSRCTFYRKDQSGIYHIIMPDPMRRSAKYDIKVFPHHPLLDEDFESKFPDNLGISTGLFGYLAKSGVGPDQEQYWCRTEEGFKRDFEKRVKDYLLESAVPFLNTINSWESMRKVIRVKSYLEIMENAV